MNRFLVSFIFSDCEDSGNFSKFIEMNISDSIRILLNDTLVDGNKLKILLLLLEVLLLPLDFLELLRFEIIFVLEVSNFCKFLIEIPNFFLESSQAWLFLFIYNLEFGFFLILLLFLFGHCI